MDINEFPVGSNTNTKSLGSAIFEHCRNNNKVVLSAMGSICIEKAIKGVLAANKLLAPLGKYILIYPQIADRPMKKEDSIKTVTLFKLKVVDIETSE